MIMPTKGTYRITTPFRYRSSAYYSGYHTGVDFATPTGTQIVAVNKGNIVASQFDNSGFGYGNYITLYDGKYYWRYAHLSSRSVAVGRNVNPGQILGRTGNTGLSSGPHLHFECATSNSFTAPISSFKDPIKIIKESNMLTRSQYNVLVRFYLGRAGKNPEKWVGKMTFEQAQKKLVAMAEYKKLVASARQGRVSLNHLPQAIRKAVKTN